jgi:hypothetical protein
LATRTSKLLPSIGILSGGVKEEAPGVEAEAEEDIEEEEEEEGAGAREEPRLSGED